MLLKEAKFSPAKLTGSITTYQTGLGCFTAHNLSDEPFVEDGAARY